jgi:hypothetical protein
VHRACANGTHCRHEVCHASKIVLEVARGGIAVWIE